MATKYHNITGELTQALLEAGDNLNVSKISLTNIEGTNNCTVDLYIEKVGLGKFYILFIKLTKSASETPAVDVILQ